MFKKKMGRIPKSGYPQKIGDILKTVLKQRNIELSVKDQSIWDAWSKAVGPLIASQTNVDRFNRETLFLKVSSPAWMHQLQFMKNDIIQKMNDILGKEVVKKLFFYIGNTASVSSKKTDGFVFQPSNHILKDREKRFIEKCLTSLNDLELVEILRRAMTKNLIRRKMDEQRKDP